MMSIRKLQVVFFVLLLPSILFADSFIDGHKVKLNYFSLQYQVASKSIQAPSVEITLEKSFNAVIIKWGPPCAQGHTYWILRGTLQAPFDAEIIGSISHDCQYTDPILNDSQNYFYLVSETN